MAALPGADRPELLLALKSDRAAAERVTTEPTVDRAEPRRPSAMASFTAAVAACCDAYVRAVAAGACCDLVSARGNVGRLMDR